MQSSRQTELQSQGLTNEERTEAQRLVSWGLDEDLGDAGDVTSTVLIPATAEGQVEIVIRQSGVLAGLPLVEMVFQQIDPRVQVRCLEEDGRLLPRGSAVAELSGPVRSLLTGERTALNFLTLLSGVATLTHRYVEAVKGTKAVVLDTRKTLPGYRKLQKYAVRCGGGRNHRMGLFDAILIKDNHLAAWTAGGPSSTIDAAIHQARTNAPKGMTIEVEVDSLDQLQAALPAGPEIILVDNFAVPDLRRAVAMRDELAPGILLEASGGVTLDSIRSIAETGVDRISAGALTHSAPALDLAFDWAGQ